MKKLDKLILGSFIGPFLLTFVVVDFILLTVNMLKYFDEIFGKGLSFMIYLELISYFVISISPMAFPLAVLLSSLMTFGNLGEHFELTAIKSSGISLLRALLPIGVFVVLLTILAFLSNNYLVPKVNLKTFSLLYDIRMKSPSFDIKEGVFYNGIPNHSIKVNQKVDDVRLKDIIIYQHLDGQWNSNVILADSGRMEPFFNSSYMSLTLYHGYNYKESKVQRGIHEKPTDFSRTKFSENQIIFNLESFQLNRTPEDLWSTNRAIKDISELKVGLDSIFSEINYLVYYNYTNSESSYPYFTRNRKLEPPKEISIRKEFDDSIKAIKASKIVNDSMPSSATDVTISIVDDSISLESISVPGIKSSSFGVVDSSLIFEDTSLYSFKNEMDISEIQLDSNQVQTSRAVKRSGAKSHDSLKWTAKEYAVLDSVIVSGNYLPRAASVGLNNARSIKNNITTKLSQIDNLEREYRRFEITWYQKYTTAIACFVMFMIGAPLGAIIKKGGLGMPVLFSIIFFIVYYMLTITGEKWAKEGVTNALFGTSFSIIVLVPFGLFFLKQARRDARLFESDLYIEYFKKFRAKISKK
jgi:lipopolysaccharide export system permease protein